MGLHDSAAPRGKASALGRAIQETLFSESAKTRGRRMTGPISRNSEGRRKDKQCGKQYKADISPPAHPVSAREGRHTWSRSNYTPLNASVGTILREVSNSGLLRLPPRMRIPARKRNLNRYCHFHKERGHLTDECRYLKEEIEHAIQHGHLSRFIHVRTPGLGTQGTKEQ